MRSRTASALQIPSADCFKTIKKEQSPITEFEDSLHKLIPEPEQTDLANLKFSIIQSYPTAHQEHKLQHVFGRQVCRYLLSILFLKC